MRNPIGSVGRRALPGLLLGLSLWLGCDATTFSVWTASLGGASPGSRGSVQVAFVNNTPFFASFTFGMYDPLDETIGSSSGQFFADADHPDRRLERNSTSRVFTLQTGRRLALGTQALLDRIRSTEESIDSTTLKVGVTFSDRLLDEPGVQSVTLHDFNNQELTLGEHYVTGSVVIFTFEPDPSAPGGIRVDVDVILPQER